jgi:hypothetical protein
MQINESYQIGIQALDIILRDRPSSNCLTVRFLN